MEGDFNLREQMAVNVKWVGMGYIVSYILQFVVWAVLARMLSPSSFGALGIALALTNFIVIFNELGMGAALIQRKDLTPQHKITTFWISLAIGVVFLILAFLSSPFIAYFFKNQAIRLLIIIIAVKLLVDSSCIVHEVLLQRELNFKRLNFIEIASSLVFAVVAILGAHKGLGIISMGWGYLAKSVLKTLLLWLNSSFRPRLEFDRKSFEELFSFGKNIVGFKIFSYMSHNIDVFLIGKLLGTLSLGYYSLAMSLVNFPRQKLSFIISKVAFPAFSRIQEDKSQVRQAYLKLVRYAAAINFPLLIGLVLVAPRFIPAVYSSKWIEMVLPLQALSIYGLFFSITTFTGVIFQSMGRPQYSFKLSLFMLVGVTVAVLVGLKYKLVGVSISLSVFAVALNVIGAFMIGRIIKMKFISYLETMFPAALASAIMALSLFVFKVFIELLGLGDLLSLVLMISGGGIVYVLSLFLVSRNTFTEMAEIIRRMLKS